MADRERGKRAYEDDPSRADATQIDYEPAWSPDGSKIVFDGRPNPHLMGRLAVLDLTDRSEQVMIDSGAANPDWQPVPDSPTPVIDPGR
ncbi:MAG: hypothetical protein ACREQY_08900, partial [Candidatus Binatia bacterium]